MLQNLFGNKKKITELEIELEKIKNKNTEMLNEMINFKYIIENIYTKMENLTENVKKTLSADSETLEKANNESNMLRRISMMASMYDKFELDYEDKIRLNSIVQSYIDYLEIETSNDHAKYLGKIKTKNDYNE